MALDCNQVVVDTVAGLLDKPVLLDKLAPLDILVLLDKLAPLGILALLDSRPSAAAAASIHRQQEPPFHRRTEAVAWEVLVHRFLGTVADCRA